MNGIVAQLAALIEQAEAGGRDMSTEARLRFEIAKRDAFRHLAETLLDDTDAIRAAEKVISGADQKAARAQATLTELELVSRCGDLSYESLDSAGTVFSVAEDGQRLGTVRVEGPLTVSAERSDGEWVGWSSTVQSAAVALVNSWKDEGEQLPFDGE